MFIQSVKLLLLPIKIMVMQVLCVATRGHRGCAAEKESLSLSSTLEVGSEMCMLLASPHVAAY